jgi:hypothetical protein
VSRPDCRAIGGGRLFLNPRQTVPIPDIVRGLANPISAGRGDKACLRDIRQIIVLKSREEACEYCKIGKDDFFISMRVVKKTSSGENHRFQG